eukprot:TRINITY_DN52096_c0_g3_i2.p1 TRINITY_DN52096_c0_g3~~TRINITY_DN52096_c0_g3_i2.p1  ORF type:complete len:561 (-),score=110.00 TRINITY_DN52096_c0_g3_i2:394-2076(-)
MRLQQAARRALTGLVIEERWLLQGIWFNLLSTLGCVHSMVFGAFHMEFFLRRGLLAAEVAAVHVFFSLWNPLNDIVAGLLADEWVARGYGSRLALLAWANSGYSLVSLLAFQDIEAVPVWIHYALVIFASDGFAAVSTTVQSLLLVEQTTEEKQRIQIQRLNSVFGCCEWAVMAIAYWLWAARGDGAGSFRTYVMLVCAMSISTTLLAARALRGSDLAATPTLKGDGNAGGVERAKQHVPELPEKRASFWSRLRPFLGTAFRHWNFICYVIVCAVLEAETIFFKQFDVVLFRVLLVSWPAASRLLLTVSDPLCGCLSFLLTWIAERPQVGTYGVTLATLRVKLLVCSAMLLLLTPTYLLQGGSVDAGETYSPDARLACTLGVLMVLCRASTRPMSSFSGIIFTSIIQEHPFVAEEQKAARAHRDAEELSELQAQASKSPRDVGDESRKADSKQRTNPSDSEAGKYWMVRAALIKPLNSLGPIAGTSMLRAAGYVAQPGEGDEDTAQNVTGRLWWICAAAPAGLSFFCALVAYRSWSRFTLHGPRLQRVASSAAASQGGRL